MGESTSYFDPNLLCGIMTTEQFIAGNFSVQEKANDNAYQKAQAPPYLTPPGPSPSVYATHIPQKSLPLTTAPRSQRHATPLHVPPPYHDNSSLTSDGQHRRPQQDSPHWNLPLHIAIEQGHEVIVRVLLQASVDINERDAAGQTALHIAVHTKQEGMLRILLQHSPDVNAVDKIGWTPVHHAVQNGFVSGLKILIEHGVNLGLRAPRKSPSG
ncbi:hypothetical protein N7540_003980 [Penicillium herquei]|nr:hypothetical protein N7540_003980 [Penicillium herquei]